MFPVKPVRFARTLTVALVGCLSDSFGKTVSVGKHRADKLGFVTAVWCVG